MNRRVNRPVAKTLLYLALFLVGFEAAEAQQGPPIASPLMLATIPDLTVAQQLELRKIFVQRRDAEEATFNKQQADFAALRAKSRSEHDRIDDNTDASLRKLLGDEGYRKFALWQLAHHPDGSRGRGGQGGGVTPGGPRPSHEMGDGPKGRVDGQQQDPGPTPMSGGGQSDR